MKGLNQRACRGLCRVTATLLFASTLAQASAHADEARLRDELDQVLVRLAQAGQLTDLPIAVDMPARRMVDFGAVIDRDGHDGLLVLGVLPGGGAESLGLTSGDYVLAANTIDLVGRGGSERLRNLLSILEDEEQLTLQIRRKDRVLDLAGVMPVHDLPAARLELTAQTPGSNDPNGATSDSRCARVSVFPGAPKSRDLFPAAVVAIGDRGASPSLETFRLEPGQRQITVAEKIDNHWFSAIANRQRLSTRPERYKTLTIDVEAGTTYFIAARLHRDRASRISEGDYWEPVVWKERAERCR